MVQHGVDEIILQKRKLTVEDETHENIDNKVDEDDLYELDKMSPDDKNDANVHLKANKTLYAIKRY